MCLGDVMTPGETSLSGPNLSTVVIHLIACATTRIASPPGRNSKSSREILLHEDDAVEPLRIIVRRLDVSY